MSRWVTTGRGQSITKEPRVCETGAPEDAVCSPGGTKEEDSDEDNDNNIVFCLAAALKSRKQE